MTRLDLHRDLYQKYPHIIPKSIEEIPIGEKATYSKLKSKGLICIIKCKNHKTEPKCLKTRVINIQDAKQVTMCEICIRLERSKRRKEKRSSIKS